MDDARHAPAAPSPEHAHPSPPYGDAPYGGEPYPASSAYGVDDPLGETPLPGPPAGSAGAAPAQRRRRPGSEYSSLDEVLTYARQEEPPRRPRRGLRGGRPGSGAHPAAAADPGATRPMGARRPAAPDPGQPVPGGPARPAPAGPGVGRRFGDATVWLRRRSADGFAALRGVGRSSAAAARAAGARAGRVARGSGPTRRLGPRPGGFGGAAGLSALPLAVGMFTVLPVPPALAHAAGAHGTAASAAGPAAVPGQGGAGGQGGVDRAAAAGALRWLPVLGALLGLVGWAVALLFWRGHGHGIVLLAAVAWVVTLALLTRGLHLDGLADLADGLGSRRPAPEALEIMRRSDIGAFGVAAVGGVLLLQIGAIVAVLAAGSRAQALVTLLVVAVVGRVAALDAARPSVPSARPDGFGGLVAGTATPVARAVAVAVPLVLGYVLLGLTATSFLAALWLPAAALAGLAAGRLLTWHAVRRLGGVTGDVFGALIEVATTVTLLVLAVIITWDGLY
ncbi:MAG: adenosylcobinamide-GDP ribazoletransferase [Frankia sp.]|nr:adenosylcobinamide-GDP ribazoletransferase [Frankia sp.]